MRPFLPLLLLLASCDFMTTKTVELDAVGLWTNQSPLLSPPPGALTTAENIVIDRPGVASAIRGQKRRPYQTPGTARSFHAFDGKVFFYASGLYEAGEADYTALPFLRTDGTPSAGNVPKNFVSLGERVRTAVARSALFIQSTAGLFSADSGGYPTRRANAVRALDIGSATAVTGSPAWLANNGAVAYRAVWGRTNAHGREIRGAPSGRYVVVNTSGASKAVELEVVAAYGTKPGDFLEVYRTSQVDSTTKPDDPGDDMRLVYRWDLPATLDDSEGELPPATIPVTDVTPDEFRDRPLYANALQEGLLQANDEAPAAKEMAVFRDCLFLGNTQGLQRLTFRILGVPDEGDTLHVGGVPFTYGGSNWPVASGSAYQQVEQAARSLVRAINLHPEASVYARYDSLTNEPPGRIVLEERQLNWSGFSLSVSRNPERYDPILPLEVFTYEEDSGSIDTTGDSVVRFGGIVTVTLGSQGGVTREHGLVPGQQLALDSETLVTIDGTTDSTFTFEHDGPDEDLSGRLSFTLTPANAPAVGSRADTFGNRLAYSKKNQPEAFPLSNYLVVGDEDEPILRVLALRDSLWVLKGKGGLYRVTGDYGAWRVERFNDSVELIAPESAVVLENQIFALTNKGVVSISDSGVDVVDVPIANVIQEWVMTHPDDVADAVAAASEVDHRYTLWLGATGWVYNAVTEAWTTRTESSTPAAAFASPYDGKLHLAFQPEPFDYRISVERRTGTSADFQNEDGEAISVNVAWVVKTARAPEYPKQWTEVEVLFEEKQDGAFSFAFTPDGDESSLIVDAEADDYPAVRTEVHEQAQRCARLGVRMQRDVLAQPLNILGVSATARLYSGKLVR